MLLLAVLVTLSFPGIARSAQATVDLGGAESFGALSFTAMTNAGADTVVYGDIGSPTSIDAGVTNPGFAAYGAGSAELAMAQAGLLMPTTSPQRKHQPVVQRSASRLERQRKGPCRQAAP